MFWKNQTEENNQKRFLLLNPNKSKEHILEKIHEATIKTVIYKTSKPEDSSQAITAYKAKN